MKGLEVIRTTQQSLCLCHVVNMSRIVIVHF